MEIPDEVAYDITLGGRGESYTVDCLRVSFGRDVHCGSFRSRRWGASRSA
jgi:hypothetical protein